MSSSHHIKQEGYSKVKSKKIPHELYKIISYLRMDFSSTLQYENLLEENNGRNKYWNWPSKDYWLKYVQNINKHTM